MLRVLTDGNRLAYFCSVKRSRFADLTGLKTGHYKDGVRALRLKA